MRAGRKNAASYRTEDAVDGEQRQNDDALAISVGWRRTQVGMLSNKPAIEPMTH